MAEKTRSRFEGNPQPSVTADTFFSTDVGSGEYQIFKVSTYGNKVSFNFYKGRAGESNKTQQYVSFDFETVAMMVKYVIEPLIRKRQMCFNAGEEYPVGIWLNYAITFMDKDSRQLRTVGNFIIKCEVCPSTQRNTVYVCYTNGQDEWKIALGSSAIQSHTTYQNPLAEDLDIGDSRFHQFAYLLNSIICNWASIQMGNHMIGIMMNHFRKIEDKLGIPSSKYSGRDGGNYATDSYRSSEPDSNELDPTAGADAAGSFGEDMPF